MTLECKYCVFYNLAVKSCEKRWSYQWVIQSCLLVLQDDFCRVPAQHTWFKRWAHHEALLKPDNNPIIWIRCVIRERPNNTEDRYRTEMKKKKKDCSSWTAWINFIISLNNIFPPTRSPALFCHKLPPLLSPITVNETQAQSWEEV